MPSATALTVISRGAASVAFARGSGDVTATQDADGYTRFEYTQKVRIPRR